MGRGAGALQLRHSILPGLKDRDNVNAGIVEGVDDDVGQAWKHNLAGARGSARSSGLWKLLKAIDGAKEAFGTIGPEFRIYLGNVG